MGERLRTTAARHPERALGVLAAVALLGAALAAGSTGGLTLSDSGSERPGLQIRVQGALPARSPAYRVAVRTMQAQLSANQAVGGVRVRRHGTSTVLLVDFDVGGRRRDAALTRIERNLDPGPLTIAFAGPAAAAREAKDDALGALLPLLVALLVVALLATVTLGVRRAGAALLSAAAAAALAALLCELLAEVADVYWLALVGAAAGGTLVALQLCAITAAGAAPRTSLAAGFAAAATFAATAALGVGYLASLGVGGALGSLLAVPASLVAMAATADLGSDGARSAAPWGKLAELVGWSRVTAVAIGLLAVALALIVAAPVAKLVTAAIGRSTPATISGTELGVALGIAALATLAVAAAVGRRVGLALAATLAAAAPALASAGLMVAVFQDGRLEGPLDYSSNGTLQLGSSAAAITVVAAVCAAQAVALVGAAGDTAGDVAAVRAAIGRSGPAAGLACLAGAAAGVALLAGSPDFVKQFGLGVAAGLLLELLLMQALVAPALVRLTPARSHPQ